MPEQRVLVIDDEQHLCALITEILVRDGLTVQTAQRGDSGLELLNAPDSEYDLVFVDMMLPDTEGIEVLKSIKRSKPQVPVVMMTGFASKESAVEAMRLGAYDYLAKPFNIDDVSLIARRALERTRLIDENRYLRAELLQRYHFDNIVGASEKVQAAYVLAAKVANENATVLITGESGTGKEMLARTIHYQSRRADKPFVKVNCAALPEHLLEDELFGHEKGAFTDAHTQRIGRFEWAHTGTIFLDEIGEVPQPVQVKLLRVLQEREFERIGSSKTTKVDVRIIAATNKDLPSAIADGTFREDLYYRLSVVPIELPPLRERREDIPLLVEHFIQKYCDDTGRHCGLRVDNEAMQLLMQHPWRGNIRELQNCIERAVILSEDETIQARHLLLGPAGMNVQAVQTWAAGARNAEIGTANGAGNAEALPTLREAERQLIARALERTQGDEAAAAGLLDIDVETLREKRAPEASAEAGSADGKPHSGSRRASDKKAANK